MAKKKQGIDNGVIASLGKQLTNKVDNGVLTRKQAGKVKDQRTLLSKAFGPDWRVKVYGNKEGAKGLNPLNVRADRSKFLRRAQNKLNVGVADSTTLRQPAVTKEREKRKRANGGTTAP